MTVSRSAFLMLATMGGLVSATGSLARADVIFVDVDATGANNGTTWDDAFNDLQDGFAAADSGDEIWVAQGTYAPAPPDGDRSASFELASGVGLYGGFAGDETDLDQRDPEVNVTILSGDLNGNDGPDFTGYEENSYHVVVFESVHESTLLDGLTITAGKADGDQDPSTCFGGDNHGQSCTVSDDCTGGECVSVNSIGAGILNISGGTPTIHNCSINANHAKFQGGGMMNKGGAAAIIIDTTFSDNFAGDNGGAMYNGASSVVLAGCLFANNTTDRYAGAICNRDLSDALITNCVFEGNVSGGEITTGGGAIVNASSSPTFSDCPFSNNVSTVGAGGAMYNKVGFNPDLGSSNPVIERCTFIDNTASFGGALYNVEDSEPVIVDSSFLDNSAVLGGAVYTSLASPEFSGCIFDGNSASLGGAAYDSSNATPSYTHCILTNNVADIYGGAIYAGGGAELSITNCVFELNTAGDESIVYGYGGGLYCFGCSAIITQSIFQSNVAGGAYSGGIYFESSPNAFVENSLFNGNHGGAGAAIAAVFGTSLQITNCTITSNGGNDNTGGVYEHFASVTVHNSILWNNTDLSTSAQFEGDVTLSHCTVQHLPSSYLFNGNDDLDPSFIDLLGPNGMAGDYDDDLRLGVGSLSIDSGDNDLIFAPTDLADSPRFVDADFDGVPIVDRGAYEALCENKCVILDCDFDSDGDGVLDCADNCPDDPDKSVPGDCGCNVDDADDDSDGVSDCIDNCPGLSNPLQEDCDNDGVGNLCYLVDNPDEDCNGNSVPDSCDQGYLNSLLLESPPTEYASFGDAAAVSGNLIVVGSPGDDSGRGSAEVFRYSDEGTWVHEQKLLAEDGESDNLFGVAVSAQGDVIAIGASQNSAMGDYSGAVYVFRHDGTEWVQEGKLTAEDGGAFDYFGAAVALNGDTLVIGAEGDDDQTTNAGAAYVFHRDEFTWAEQQKLFSSDVGFYGFWGTSVAVDDDTIVIGSESHAVDVFQYDGTWTHQQRLVASDGSSGNYFGRAVALHEGTIAIGAYRDDTNVGNDVGSVYVFSYDGTWYESQNLFADDGEHMDYFGIAVALDGDTIVVGASLDDDHGNNSGAAYVFRFHESSWTQENKLYASDAMPSDRLGEVVAVENELVVIGASSASTEGVKFGAAYAADMSIWDNDGNGILDICEICPGDANGDGSVDPLDGGFVLAQFGCPVGTGDPLCDAADQNGDGAVDPLDSGYVLARFGQCP